MYHSLTFIDSANEKMANTFKDWHLVPTVRPFFAPPEPKTKYLDIPGANGSIDLTESLTGYPVFNNRSGEWTFYVLNDSRDWIERYSTVLEFLQGKKLKVVLEDDPCYYYEGRFYVSNWSNENGSTWSQITINYNVGPFKKPLNGIEEERF